MPYSDPKFTVVNPNPDVDDCIKSMRIRDYAVALGITASSWSYGYIFGKPARMPTASTAAAIGFTFATMLIFQDTRGRLMGYAENAREVNLYGAASSAYQPASVGDIDRRFPKATGIVSDNIKPAPKYRNYN
mmetsp:Transcript_2339/g.3131  ORF Transcript_2339/g.3131 Transcript_2339/m.3131 type:complete len:132 (-) Transcript_2339:210-605(-)